jgi:predicted Zn-dependent protease
MHGAELLNRLNLFVLLLLALLILTLAACQTSPTGRRQLALVSDRQLEEMGGNAFAEMKAKRPTETAGEQLRYVSCVANTIIATLPEKREWELALFQDETANAFALPGGKIGIHTGLLKVAANQHQLAAVVGHELAHVLADHPKERVSEQLAAQGGIAILGSVLGNSEDPRHGLLMAALGLGAQFGVLLPHGRRQETEADTLGLEYMAKAGFDPQQAIGLWENMEAAGGERPPEFLSTHPSHGTRIENLKANMPRALELFGAAEEKAKCK